jgi:hypothetical protein
MATAAMTEHEEPTLAGDDVLAALEQVTAALAGAKALAREIAERGDSLARQRADGRSWREITQAEDRPRTANLLRESLDVLVHANSRYRRALACELHDDGTTMQGIADLLGITRQRVAVLLKGQDEKES